MVFMQLLKLPLLLGRWTNRAVTSTPISNLQLRSQATQVDSQHLELKCGDRFQQKPCDPTQQEIKLKQPAPVPLPLQKRSIRLKHPMECCGNPCIDAYPRFDLLYYKRTDKLNRPYQQTWDECPEMKIEPKIICCFDKIKPAKWQKRPRKHRPQTACEQQCSSASYKCPRITMKNCREVRYPPKCRPTRHPIECRCLLAPSMCEVWAYYFKQQKIKKVGLC